MGKTLSGIRMHMDMEFEKYSHLSLCIRIFMFLTSLLFIVFRTYCYLNKDFSLVFG